MKETKHGWANDKCKCEFAGYWDCSFFCNKKSTKGKVVPCPMKIPDYEKCEESKKVTEQIPGFNEAYKIIKANGFENYFCIPGSTWKEAKERFDKGHTLAGELFPMVLRRDVDVVLSTEKLTFCAKCKCILNPQEAKAGYKVCEHCEK